MADVASLARLVSYAAHRAAVHGAAAQRPAAPATHTVSSPTPTQQEVRSNG